MRILIMCNCIYTFYIWFMYIAYYMNKGVSAFFVRRLTGNTAMRLMETKNPNPFFEETCKLFRFFVTIFEKMRNHSELSNNFLNFRTCSTHVPSREDLGLPKSCFLKYQASGTIFTHMLVPQSDEKVDFLTMSDVAKV